MHSKNKPIEVKNGIPNAALKPWQKDNLNATHFIRLYPLCVPIQLCVFRLGDFDLEKIYRHTKIYWMDSIWIFFYRYHTQDKSCEIKLRWFSHFVKLFQNCITYTKIINWLKTLLTWLAPICEIIEVHFVLLVSSSVYLISISFSLHYI